VLRDIATVAERGELTAILHRNGDLEAVRIVDGEPIPAEVDIVEDDTGPESGSVDWQDNQFIRTP